MMNQIIPFFSIVIPIYNVSRFVDSGLKFILDQIYEDYEILLIDDGSTDDSKDKCDYVERLHSNIHCYHQDNKGSGPARNLGIEKAKGKYICFFDIDDKIDDDFLSRCYKLLVDNCEPDVLMFSYDSYDVKYKSLTSVVFSELKCQSNQDIRENYVEHLSGIENVNGFVWNKIYKRQFLLDNSLSFPALLIQQDEVFNLHVYRKARSLVVSPEILYHYFVYDKGNTRSRYIENRLKIYQTVKDEFLSLYDYWKLEDKRMLAYVYNRYFNSIIGTLNFNNNHKDSPLCKVERDKELKSIINDAETQECLEKLDELGASPKNGFDRYYYNAIRERNVVKYKLLRALHLNLQTIKRRLKGI
mgnify:CR=1 FL=1